VGRRQNPPAHNPPPPPPPPPTLREAPCGVPAHGGCAAVRKDWGRSRGDTPMRAGQAGCQVPMHRRDGAAQPPVAAPC
ncbi:hypothetical protein ACX84C_20990, partial [Xanthomonas euvesicatoria]